MFHVLCCYDPAESAGVTVSPDSTHPFHFERCHSNRSTSCMRDSNISLVHWDAAKVASGRKFWEGKTSILMVYQ